MYAIGLDIGIASVGYAVVALDEKENPYRFIRLGVRIFDAAEERKNGASLALPRRKARGTRRRIRRHRHRLERIKRLFVEYTLIDEDGLNHLFDGKLSDIYALRVKSLDSRIEDSELCRILIHLAQRRGFKSNRKAALKDKKAGQLLTAVKENDARMKAHGYRTVGEMLLKDELFAKCKRNKGESYITTVRREQIEDEARKILKAQQEFGNEKVTGELIEKYIEILTSQRRYDEGPAEPSPYAGNQIKNMIGNCTFEVDQLRAAKACYSFEYFNLLSKVNHIYLVHDGERKPLSAEQRKTVIALAHKTAKLYYSQIREKLELSDDTLFNDILRDDYLEREKKAKFQFLPAYHDMRIALDKVSKGAIKSISIEKLDEIGMIIATYKGDEKRIEEFKKLSIPKEYAEALLEVDHSKFCHLSLKALRKIIPFLEQGMTYDAACQEAGYNFRAHNGRKKDVRLPAYVPEMAHITSPVARRAISQTIKVVNAIIRDQGRKPPVYINVELAREMSKNFKERKSIEEINEKKQADNESLKGDMRKDFGISDPKGFDIVKLRLWKEQKEISPYSQKVIKRERLFEPGYVDVDHIVPYSKCFDDSYKNKVLVLSSENREKGNRLPLEYLRSRYGKNAADNFIVWVKNNVHDRRKRENLLKEVLTEEERSRFKERNLQDTRTISRFMLNFIRDYLAFAPSKRKERVTAVNGVLTSYLRKRWGLNKTRENGDKHHALDAAVIVCVTRPMINKVSNYAERHEGWLREDIKEGEKHFRIPFPLPWRYFKDELRALLSENPAEVMHEKKIPSYAGGAVENLKPIFVSRMPNHKVTGEAHEATIVSQMPGDEGFYVTKVPITKLKLAKDGEIENYYNPGADKRLYEELKKQLKEFNGKAEEAFANGFYRSGKHGTQRRPVKKVKIRLKGTLTVPVHRNPEISADGAELPKAVASKGAMVRVDVFYVEEDGYYLVPVYISDTIKPVLPNKAIVSGKSIYEWKTMKDENFLFSLYINDLIKVKHKRAMQFSKSNENSSLAEQFETNEALVYYKGTDISRASISVITHDNSYKARVRVKTLFGLEKYQVDVLGNISKVKKEVRQKFR